MRIEIETQIKGGTTHLLEINRFIERVKMCSDLHELADLLGSKKFDTLSYGFGNAHCWVKQKDINGNLHEERCLYIHK